VLVRHNLEPGIHNLEGFFMQSGIQQQVV
jgi:hypothetical protein